MNIETVTWSRITARDFLIVALAIAATWFFLRYVRRGLEAVAHAKPRMRFLVRLLEPVLRILVWIGVFLFSAQQIAPTPDAFLAELGVVAIAIGLGARDLIKNLIGGFVIVADRPYQLGDRVEFAGAYGEIRHIGLRSTKIMTDNDTLVTVPNSKLLDGIAQNSNAGVPEALVVAEVFLPPNTDPDLALQVGRNALITCPFLCLRRRTAVDLADGFSDNPYLVLKMKGYVYEHRYEPQMKTDLIRRSKAELHRLGIRWVSRDT